MSLDVKQIYAVARLENYYQADESAEVSLVVDESNLETLLQLLNI